MNPRGENPALQTEGTQQTPGAQAPMSARITISNDTKFLSVVREFIARQAAIGHVPVEDENKIILAVDEAVANIIEHAYEHQRVGMIDVETSITEGRFKVSIRDSGKKFRPDSIETPDILSHVKMGKKKGLGIFLMRQVMDEVRYIFKEGVENELVLVKYFQPARATPKPAETQEV